MKIGKMSTYNKYNVMTSPADRMRAMIDLLHGKKPGELYSAEAPKLLKNSETGKLLLLESVYPDNDEGVKQFVKAEISGTSDQLRMRIDTHIVGVWLVVDDANEMAYIVYLNEGEHGEFENVDYDQAIEKYFRQSMY